MLIRFQNFINEKFELEIVCKFGNSPQNWLFLSFYEILLLFPIIILSGHSLVAIVYATSFYPNKSLFLLSKTNYPTKESNEC